MLRSVIACAVLAGTGLTAHAANIVTNGSFESPNFGGEWDFYGSGSNLGGWTVDANWPNGGVVHVGTFGTPAAYDGDYSVELAYFNAGGVAQTLTTTPGQTYRITFAMAGQLYAGPNTKSLNVQWNSGIAGQFTWDATATGGEWQLHQLFVTATGTSSYLRFAGTVDQDGGAYLDAVSVEAIDAAAVPTPAAAAGGLMLLGGLLAKRRRD